MISGAASISGTHRRILAVEDPRRVAAEPAAAILVERALVLAQVLHQLIAVDLARFRGTE